MVYTICILLVLSAALDIRYQQVYLPLNLLIFIISIHFERDIKDILLSLLVPLSLLLINLIKKKETVGYGDIEFLVAVAPFLGYTRMVISFFTSTLFLTVYHCIYKKGRVPYIPFLVIGIFVSVLPV